jgi:predicted amidohydrolase
MRLCLLPLRVRYRDPQRNFRHLEERLSELARSKLDLVCLPECALTGYLYFDGPSPDPERWERDSHPQPRRSKEAPGFIGGRQLDRREKSILTV